MRDVMVITWAAILCLALTFATFRCANAAQADQKLEQYAWCLEGTYIGVDQGSHPDGPDVPSPESCKEWIEDWYDVEDYRVRS